MTWEEIKKQRLQQLSFSTGGNNNQGIQQNSPSPWEEIKNQRLQEKAASSTAWEEIKKQRGFGTPEAPVFNPNIPIQTNNPVMRAAVNISNNQIQKKQNATDNPVEPKEIKSNFVVNRLMSMAPKVKNVESYKNVVDTLRKGGEQIVSFAQGAGDSATLGLMSSIPKRVDPDAYNKMLNENPTLKKAITGEDSKVARVAGNFLGYMAPYGAATKGISMIPGVGSAIGNISTKAAASLAPTIGAKAAGVVGGFLGNRAIDSAVDIGLGVTEGMVRGQNAGEIATNVATDFLFGSAIDAIGAGTKALKKAKIQESKVMPGIVGNQTPVIDRVIREKKNMIQELDYNKFEFGDDTSKQVDALINEVKNLERARNLPLLKKQVNTLEQISKELIAEGKAITPQNVNAMREINRLNAVIKEVEPLYNQYKPKKSIMDPFMINDSVKQGINQPKPFDSPFLKDYKAENPVIKPAKASNIQLKEDTLTEINEGLKDVARQVDQKAMEFAPELTDKKMGASYNFKDLYRNFRDVTGDRFSYFKKNYLDPFDDAKKVYTESTKKQIDNLYDNVVIKHGIKKGSPESAAIQMFGEGKRQVIKEVDGIKQHIDVPYTEVELRKEFPESWEKIKEAERYFRGVYDDYIDKINATRKQIYPHVEAEIVKAKNTLQNINQKIFDHNSGKNVLQQEQLKKLFEQQKEFSSLVTGDDLWRGKRIPKRNDYYRHFNEISETMKGLQNLFETPAQIDPRLAGISDFTKPNAKFLSLAQRQGKGKYTADAVGGMLNYIPSAEHAINIDPFVTKFRGLAKDLAEGTKFSKNTNGFIEFLNDFSNDLAGKTNQLDRSFQKLTNRKVLDTISFLNSRVKANAVLGNLSSSISQFANIPNGIAYVKNPIQIAEGTKHALLSFVGKGDLNLYNKSGFLQERYLDDIYRKFDTKILDQPKKFAAAMIQIGDNIGTKIIWSSVYRKGLADKVLDPIRYADEVTRSLVAGRGIGEVPLLQKSKIFQLVAPFQLEVANLWHIQKDFLTNKDFSGLLILYVSNFLTNKIMESIRGSGVVFDPINAIIEAFQEEDISPIQRLGRVGGEIFSNLPVGQNAAALLPEDLRKDFFGRNDPTRFGTGFLLTRAIQKPVESILLPYGGTQLRKTYEGAKSIQLLPEVNPGKSNFLQKQPISGSISNDKEGNPRLRYPIDKTFENISRILAFGQYATAVDYFKNNTKMLGTDQTEKLIQAHEMGVDLKNAYDVVLEWRNLEPSGNNKGVTKNQKLEVIWKNDKLTPVEKQKLILLFFR